MTSACSLASARFIAPLISLLSLLLLLVSSPLWAHTQLKMGTDIPPRYNADAIKNAYPCGQESNFSNSVTGLVSIYPRGATVRVEWEETVPHDGYFLIAFSNDLGQTFVQEVRIEDPAGSSQHDFALDYTLPASPDFVCTGGPCILRVIQNMGGSVDNNYYSCADVNLIDADPSPQSPATSLSLQDNTTAVGVAWMNPTTQRGVLVLRDSQDQFTQSTLETLRVYHEGDQVGSAVVMFKSETGATQFSDTNFAADTDYYYAVYAYSDGFVYGSPVVSSIHTAMDSGNGNPNPGGGTGSGGGTPSSQDNGSGADSPLFIALLLLLAILGLRLRRRAEAGFRQ